MDEKLAALNRLLEGQATSEDIHLLYQALTRGEISISGDVTNSVILIGSGNTVTLTAEARALLQPETKTEEPAPGKAPYKGLLYFDVDDAPLFFGREALTRDLTARLKREPLLVIVGASGSGKSSLARAGLVPAWLEEYPEQTQVYIITPGAHPLESLATSLTRDSESVTAAETLAADLRQSPRSLRLYARRLLQQGKPRLLMLVDQFEETFTLCKDAEERRAFIENLLGLAEEGGEEIRLVLTLRADFYHRCADYERLRRALQEHQAYIGAMSREELRRAILQPAERAGWEFQPGLVEVMLNDTGEEPGALPLLSHALLETWKRRRGRTLTLSGYAEAGGVKKAIARTAEQVYAGLTEEERRLTRAVFLRLTELGEGAPDTRRRASLEELRAANAAPETVEHLLKTLTGARLLTASQEGVEVAHEALIREWETLRRWLDEDRQALWTHRRLTEAAAEWERSGRDEAFLVHRAGRLEDALALRQHPFLHLNQTEQAYLSACLKWQESQRKERERRLRLTVFASLSAGIIFLLLSVFAWRQSQTAQEQTKAALARQLASQAQSLFARNDSKQQRAVQLAIHSMRLLPNPEAAHILTHNTLALPSTHMVHNSSVTSVAFSPDGRYVVSGSYDGTARVWETSGGREIARMMHEGGVTSVTFSPDGRYVVSGSNDGTARVWEASGGREIARMTHEIGVTSVAFSPDGHYVVSGSWDGTARVWEASGGREIARMTHENEVTSVAFSPDGRYVVSGSVDGAVRLWEAAGGREIARMMHDDEVTSVAFSPDGRYVVSGSYDGTARVWETSGGREIARMMHEGGVTSVTFSPDGRYVVSGSNDGTARVWEASGGREIARMTHEIGVTSVAFSPDGHYVVSGSEDGTARVWEVLGGREIARLTHDGSVYSVAFSPDRRYVVSGSVDGTAWVWEAISGREIARVTHDDGVTFVTFSPDGRYLVSGSMDGTVRVWEAPGGREIARMTHDSGVTSVAFSPDGRYVVSGSWDGTVRVWQAAVGREIARMIHEGSVTSVAFSPDGRYVVSGSYDGTARVWEASGGREIARMTHEKEVTSVAFSPDGRYVV
ncbi:MAG: NACHT domain-containing protein, partial [Anaerolineales bacterium]|nr:NACHT domain-containing protein [Anaerolineales bacterium]